MSKSNKRTVICHIITELAGDWAVSRDGGESQQLFQPVILSQNEHRPVAKEPVQRAA